MDHTYIVYSHYLWCCDYLLVLKKQNVWISNLTPTWLTGKLDSLVNLKGILCYFSCVHPNESVGSVENAVHILKAIHHNSFDIQHFKKQSNHPRVMVSEHFETSFDLILLPFFFEFDSSFDDSLLKEWSGQKCDPLLLFWNIPSVESFPKGPTVQ